MEPPHSPKRAALPVPHHVPTPLPKFDSKRGKAGKGSRKEEEPFRLQNTKLFHGAANRAGVSANFPLLTVFAAYEIKGIFTVCLDGG